MELYLAIITTVLVITQIIRLIQNTIQIKQSTLSMRINKYGWSAEKALTTEVRP